MTIRVRIVNMIIIIGLVKIVNRVVVEMTEGRFVWGLESRNYATCLTMHSYI